MEIRLDDGVFTIGEYSIAGIDRGWDQSPVITTRKKISVLDFGTGLTHRRTCELAKTFDTTCRCCSNNVVSRGRHSDNPNYGYLESASAFFYSVAAACAFS